MLIVLSDMKHNMTFSWPSSPHTGLTQHRQLSDRGDDYFITIEICMSGYRKVAAGTLRGKHTGPFGYSKVLHLDTSNVSRAKVQYLHVRKPLCQWKLLVHSSCYWASLCTSQVLWSVPVETPDSPLIYFCYAFSWCVFCVTYIQYIQFKKDI